MLGCALPPLYRLLGGNGWRSAGRAPLSCLGQGWGKAGQGALAGSLLSPLLLPAGVTRILATELFDQMTRPAAYMVCGALMWTMLFLVGLGFPFIMVGLPPLPPGGPAIGFVLVSMRTPGEAPSRRRETEGDGAYLSQEG